MATRKYDKTRLDLHYKKSNENLEFYISDTDTSDFYIRLTRANMPIKVDDLIIVLCVIDPSNQVRTQFISADTNKEGFVYCKLEDSMKSQVGTYQAKVMLVYEDEKIVTDTFTYTVKNDMFVALSQEIIADERFETLNDMLSEISRIKNQEEDRVVAENGRVVTMNRIENEIAQLVLDINSRVNVNITENTNKTDELVLNVNTKVDNSLNLNTTNVNELIARGDNILSDIELNSNQLIASIDEYKNNAVEDIEVYKTTKDSEINQTLTDYKTSTTESVNSFIEGETLKLKNDLTVDCNAYKESLNTEFNKLDSDLKLNINNFVADKSTYIDTYLQGKSLELTRYINDKNVELNTYVNTKNTELNTYISNKNTELNTYKTTKNAEIDKYFNDKNTEFNNNEKTRTSNESRRETNEYARGMNENNRKSAESNRVSSFTQMTNEFNAMVQYNNQEMENKYDDIVSDGTTITMMANGVIKKSITLSNSGSGGEGHTHANKTTLDKITEDKLTSWDNKVNSVVGKGLSTNDYTTIEKTKLQGIEQNANHYIHPTIHLPSMIAQDSNNRFVTDVEKLMWNSKSNFSGSYDDLINKPIIPSEYTLPIATTTTLGGIKVGSGLSISNGVLSVTGGTDFSTLINDDIVGINNVWSSSKVSEQFNIILGSGVGGLIFEDIEDNEIFTSIVASYPCTSISLSNGTLTFTNTDTQTLTTTVLPSNCTDVVSWSSSDTTVATVSNGVVAPLKNGSCNITATCGNYSATCSVVINEITISYSVTNNLTNCSNNNTNTSVEYGSSYSAIITPNINYILGTPIITMSGVDITSEAYLNGAINISSVTGNIVITCSATSDVVISGILAEKVEINSTSYIHVKDLSKVLNVSGSSCFAANTYSNDNYQIYVMTPSMKNIIDTSSTKMIYEITRSSAINDANLLADTTEGDLYCIISNFIHIRLPKTLGGYSTPEEYLQNKYGTLKFALNPSAVEKIIFPNLITTIAVKTNDSTCQYAQFGYSDLPTVNIYSGANSLGINTGINANLSSSVFTPTSCMSTSTLSIRFSPNTFLDFTLNNVKEYLTNNPLVFWYI